MGSLGFFTGFYGNPQVSLRHHSWTLLRRIAPNPDHPWLLMGDFNEILLPEEMHGHHSRPYRQMEQFQSVIADLGLQEIKGSGPFFTWNNRRQGEAKTWSRLDRVL